MRLPFFLKRLHTMAGEAGVRIIDRCAFREPLLEDGRVAGVKAVRDGAEMDFRARLTVDASGTACAVRSALPASLGVETFGLGPSDVLFVTLRYIRWIGATGPAPSRAQRLAVLQGLLQPLLLGARGHPGGGAAWFL